MRSDPLRVLDVELEALKQQGLYRRLRVLEDEQKAKTVVAMCEAGYADHVLISSDFSHGVSMKKNGGPGIAMSVTRTSGGSRSTRQSSRCAA